MCIQPDIASKRNQRPIQNAVPQKDKAFKLTKGLKECEKHDEKRKKFKNFEGVHRPMGIMEKKEYEDIVSGYHSGKTASSVLASRISTAEKGEVNSELASAHLVTCAWRLPWCSSLRAHATLEYPKFSWPLLPAITFQHWLLAFVICLFVHAVW